MSRPRYCPDCGKPLPLPSGPFGAQAIKNAAGDGGWDCYCRACRWGGDIWPDEETADALPKER